jgi:hypothetical protein
VIASSEQVNSTQTFKEVIMSSISPFTNLGLAMAKKLNEETMGTSLSKQDILNCLKNSPAWTDNGDGTFTSGAVTASVSDDGDLNLRALDPTTGSTVRLRISDDLNREGDYSVVKAKVNFAGLTDAQNEALSEQLSDSLDLNDMYGRKNKAYGSSKGKDGRHGGLDSGDASSSSNWFIALAEVLGESLNKLANDITSQTDKVKLLKNGSAPFKDSMRLQGLAQQLSFMTQAFMTCLNSIGEAIKNSVTAGGAAR